MHSISREFVLSVVFATAGLSGCATSYSGELRKDLEDNLGADLSAYTFRATPVGNFGVGTIPINTVLVAALDDNGGPTLTHALVAGSQAIDSGSNALAVDVNGVALTTDQRGAGFLRILGGTVDIGAFESGN